MLTALLFLAGMGIAIGIVYPICCAALYPIYILSGGKLSFRWWWDKMDF